MGESDTAPVKGKARIRGATSWTRMRALQARYVTIEDAGIRGCIHHDEMLRRISEAVYRTPEMQSLHGGDSAHLAGYIAARREAIRPLVEWRVYFRGAYVPGARVPAGEWHRVDGDRGCFFWVDSAAKYGHIRPWLGAVAYGPPLAEFADCI